MAEQRTARLVTAENIGLNTRFMRFALEQPMGFSGGQYVIVHTGVAIAEGKTAKRAYSLLSSDQDQHNFELAVRRVGSGPGSSFMHDLPVGAELSFTGPWGKFVPKQAMKSPAGSTLVVASDTGITAAIGLLHASGFQPWANQTDFHWLIESDEYFLPELLVRQRIQTRCRNFTIQRIPAVGSSQRDLWIEKFCQEITSRYPDIGNLQNVFLSGDGRIAFAMRESLTNAGVSNIQIETFFNHQEKKAEAKLAAS